MPLPEGETSVYESIVSKSDFTSDERAPLSEMHWSKSNPMKGSSLVRT